MQEPNPYQPQNKIRIVTAASLFDGHDAAINIMRRIIQATGCEVIHLGHDRSVEEVVNSLGIDIRPGTDEDLRYLSGPNIAGPEEGGPGAGVPQLQAGSALHQEVDAVRPPLSGSVVQGRATLTVLDTSDTK